MCQCACVFAFACFKMKRKHFLIASLFLFLLRRDKWHLKKEKKGHVSDLLLQSLSNNYSALSTPIVNVPRVIAYVFRFFMFSFQNVCILSTFILSSDFFCVCLFYQKWQNIDTQNEHDSNKNSVTYFISLKRRVVNSMLNWSLNAKLQIRFYICFFSLSHFLWFTFFSLFKLNWYEKICFFLW